MIYPLSPAFNLPDTCKRILAINYCLLGISDRSEARSEALIQQRNGLRKHLDALLAAQPECSLDNQALLNECIFETSLRDMIYQS